jgi:hypothetical protein
MAIYHLLDGDKFPLDAYLPNFVKNVLAKALTMVK